MDNFFTSPEGNLKSKDEMVAELQAEYFRDPKKLEELKKTARQKTGNIRAIEDARFKLALLGESWYSPEDKDIRETEIFELQHRRDALTSRDHWRIDSETGEELSFEQMVEKYEVAEMAQKWGLVILEKVMAETRQQILDIQHDLALTEDNEGRQRIKNHLTRLQNKLDQFKRMYDYMLVLKIDKEIQARGGEIKGTKLERQMLFEQKEDLISELEGMFAEKYGATLSDFLNLTSKDGAEKFEEKLKKKQLETPEEIAAELEKSTTALESKQDEVSQGQETIEDWEERLKTAQSTEEKQGIENTIKALKKELDKLTKEIIMLERWVRNLSLWLARAEIKERFEKIKNLEGKISKVDDVMDKKEQQSLAGLKLTEKEKRLFEEAGRYDIAAEGDPKKIIESVRLLHQIGFDVTKLNSQMWLNKYAIMGLSHPQFLLLFGKGSMDATFNLNYTLSKNSELYLGIGKEKWLALGLPEYKEKFEEPEKWPSWSGIPGLTAKSYQSMLSVDPGLLTKGFQNMPLERRAEFERHYKAALTSLKSRDIGDWDTGALKFDARKNEWIVKPEKGTKGIPRSDAAFMLFARWLRPTEIGDIHDPESLYNSAKPKLQEALIRHWTYVESPESRMKIIKLAKHISRIEILAKAIPKEPPFLKYRYTREVERALGMSLQEALGQSGEDIPHETEVQDAA